VFNFDDYDAGGSYAIFDDFPEWKFVPNRRGWFGCQRVFSVNEKYRRKKTIQNNGRPSIYLFNADNDPRDQMSQQERDYYEQTCTFIWLYEPLFRQ